MTYSDYSFLNCYEPFALIAGTSYTIEFEVFEEDGVNPLDLGGATVKWLVSPFGQSDYNSISSNGSMTGVNKFEFNLSPSDTINLSGKFIHQPVIMSFTGEEYRPGQGILTIIPANKE